MPSTKSQARRVAVASEPKRRGPTVVAAADTTLDDSRFDRLVYERVRLGILSALAVSEELSFNELRTLVNVSDGNLGAHARKLEDAKFVTCTKSFQDRRPRSSYRLTPLGRTALNRYLDHVEAVIKATRKG